MPDPVPVHYPDGPWVRVVWHFHSSEAQWENVLWYTAEGSAASTFNINTFTAAYDANIRTFIEACLNEGSQFDGVDLFYNNGTYTSSGKTQDSSSGSGGDELMPAETAAIVRLQTNVAGPSGRGRIFFGGLAEQMTAGSRLTSAAIVTFTALRDKMINYPTNQGVHGDLVLWSRKTNALVPLAYAQVDAILGHRTNRRPRR